MDLNVHSQEIQSSKVPETKKIYDSIHRRNEVLIGKEIIKTNFKHAVDVALT
jgi:hypothetical protein